MRPSKAVECLEDIIIDEPGSIVTLADYLNGAEQTYAKLKPVVRVIPSRQLNGTLCEKAVGSTRQDPFDPMDSITVPEIMNAEIDETPSDQKGDSLEYLYRRKSVLRKLLVERYSELLQLMQDEMELTGRPPDLYHEYLHEYQSLLSITRSVRLPGAKQHRSNSRGTPIGQDVCETSAHEVDKRESLQPVPNSLAEKPLGSRLQETSFTLKPSCLRRASMTPTISCDYLHTVESKTLSQGKRSGSQVFDVLSRWQSVKDLPRDDSPCKITDFTPIPLDTVYDIHTREQFTSTPDSGWVSNSYDPEKPVVEDERTSLHRKLSLQTEYDRDRALACIDVELAALQNILKVNNQCSKETWRKKMARKAYKQAALKNQASIDRLEKQRQEILYTNLFKPDQQSVDSFQLGTGQGSIGSCSLKIEDQHSLCSRSTTSSGVTTGNSYDSSSQSSGVYDALQYMTTTFRRESRHSNQLTPTQASAPSPLFKFKSHVASDDLNKSGEVMPRDFIQVISSSTSAGHQSPTSPGSNRKSIDYEDRTRLDASAERRQSPNARLNRTPLAMSVIGASPTRKLFDNGESSSHPSPGTVVKDFVTKTENNDAQVRRMKSGLVRSVETGDMKPPSPRVRRNSRAPNAFSENFTDCHSSPSASPMLVRSFESTQTYHPLMMKTRRFSIQKVPTARHPKSDTPTPALLREPVVDGQCVSRSNERLIRNKNFVPTTTAPNTIVVMNALARCESPLAYVPRELVLNEPKDPGPNKLNR